MNPPTLAGAIIGTGFFAAFQAEAWRRIPGVSLVAAADPDQARVREFSARWEIPRVYASLTDLLAAEPVDFVDIATRPDSHLALTMEAAAAGRAVICQKPMAPTLKHCREMVVNCAERRVRLLIHENWRWQPWFRESRAIIERGDLGRVFNVSFRMRNGDGIGPVPYAVQPYFREMKQFLLYETGIHFLDTFRYLAGEVASVFCRTSRINSVIAGEDAAVVQLGFRSGASGLLDANRISGPNPPSATFGVLWVEGDEGSLRMNDEGELFIKPNGKEERAHSYPIARTGYRGDSVYAAQMHYAHCLRSGDRCESEGEEYLKSVELVYACYESAASGRLIELKETA